MAANFSDGLLNKGAGEVVNLIANGTFDTDTTGWTATDATLAVDAGALKITNSGAAQGKAVVDVTTTVGALYALDFMVTGGDGGGVSVMIGTTADEDAISTLSGFATDAAKGAFVATETTTRLTFVNTSAVAAEFNTIDDVVVDHKIDGYRDVFNGGGMNFYTGSRSASANDAAPGTLVSEVTGPNGAGLEFDGAVSGVLSKPAGTIWEGENLVTGTYGYVRMFEAGDNPAQASTTAARMDLTVGTSNADVIMDSLSATQGASTRVDNFTLTVE